MPTSLILVMEVLPVVRCVEDGGTLRRFIVGDRGELVLVSHLPFCHVIFCGAEEWHLRFLTSADVFY